MANLISFVGLTAALFVAVLGVASRIHIGHYTLLQGLTRTYEEPGGAYQSLRRFREAESAGHVDIVFLGASHTYRGYDPRAFETAGYKVMNLGSTAQTPLNTYYIAERYVPKLSPRLVVLDVFYSALSLDGLESARDLAVNTRWSWPMQRMAFATQNLGTMAFEASKAFGFAADESKATQTDIDGETYIPGGYCETVQRRKTLWTQGKLSFEIRPLQVDYLVRTTELARAGGARVVWVSAPLPRDYTSLVGNRAELRAAIEKAAKQANTEWWDFSDDDALDPLVHFKDALHLNAAGVEIFDRKFLERLGASGYLG